jgi:hypothetical protein
MSAPLNDGGPVFARTGEYWHTSPQNGMTLRDCFAAAALQGLMSKLDPEEHWADYRAKWSYEAADAMLKAKEAKL